MSIIEAAKNALLIITGRKALKKRIEAMRDYPECLGCNKTTRKIIEDMYCFQCFYDKSEEIH